MDMIYFIKFTLNHLRNEELECKMLEIKVLYQVVNIIINMTLCFQDVFSFILVFYVE